MGEETRSSSSLLKYKKRKLTKKPNESESNMLSSCLSMQQVNFQGGIGDLIKNNNKSKSKVKKNKPNMKFSRRKTIENNFKLKPGINSNFGGQSTSNSRMVDSSNSYNQITKENSNSS